MAKLTEREIEQIRKEHGIKPEDIGRQDRRKPRQLTSKPL